MYTLKLTNGDLAVRGDGATVPLTEADRIVQELRMWLLEPRGTDRMYPEFGSDLDGYVGSAITDDSLGDVRSEVVRVVGNYMSYHERIAADYLASDSDVVANAWGDRDLIASLASVDVRQDGDSVVVGITAYTVDGVSVGMDERL